MVEALPAKWVTRTFGLCVQHAGLAPLIVLLIAGCSASSPRFRTPSHDPGLLAREKEEEAREDDRKIDVEAVRKKLVPPASRKYSNVTPRGLNRDRLLLDAVSYLGVPYAYGGSTREGIDCSAFTASIYQSGAQRGLPRSAEEQYQVGSEVPEDSLQFGDLVFFNTTGQSPSHVGMYIEDDLFVHASVSYGVTISSLESTYYKTRFVGARRIVQ